MWRSRARALRLLAVGAALVVVVLSSSVLLFGWALDIASMRRLIPGLPGMAISTAAGLLACALAVLLDALRPHDFDRRWQLILASGAGLLGLVNLALLAQEPGHGIDQLLFSFTGQRAAHYMSPATAICLVLAGGSLLVSRRRGAFLNGDLHALLAATGLFITVLALTGYAFDSAALFEVLVFSAMALHTAIGFFLIFLALLMSRPAWGWMSILVGPGPGSDMLRRTLPFAVLCPFLLSWLTLVAVEKGIFNANFRLSILAISSACGLVALLSWTALRENADARDLIKKNSELRRALSDRDILLKEVYHRVKNNLQFIDAMLALESAGKSDPALNKRLSAIRMRVHAMSLVHQHLVGSQDLATVDLSSFLQEICLNQAQGAALDARGIRLETDIESIPLHLERAVPIGLIVAELLSNAVKHGFPDNRPGCIAVTARRRGADKFELVVSDDGVGRAKESVGDDPGAARQENGSVGRMIVRSLAAQLRAEVEARDEGGFSTKMTVPLEQM